MTLALWDVKSVKFKCSLYITAPVTQMQPQCQACKRSEPTCARICLSVPMYACVYTLLSLTGMTGMGVRVRVRLGVVIRGVEGSKQSILGAVQNRLLPCIPLFLSALNIMMCTLESSTNHQQTLMQVPPKRRLSCSQMLKQTTEK